MVSSSSSDDGRVRGDAMHVPWLFGGEVSRGYVDICSVDWGNQVGVCEELTSTRRFPNSYVLTWNLSVWAGRRRPNEIWAQGPTLRATLKFSMFPCGPVWFLRTALELAGCKVQTVML